MRRRNRFLSTSALLAAMLVSGAAAADGASTYPPCNKTVAPNESELAHQRYIAGKADYDEANYESAIRRFRDAYNLDCTKHELLVIISAAYERKGDKKEAIAALEAYLARSPNAPDVGTYQAKIENLKKQLAASPPPTATPPPPVTQPDKPAPTETRAHTVLPWVVVGAGAMALVAGVVVLLTAPENDPLCDYDARTCEKRSDTETQAQRDVRATDAGVRSGHILGAEILLIGGGVLVAGGLVWHFLEPTGPKDASSAKAKIRPMLSPSIAGLSLGGSF